MWKCSEVSSINTYLLKRDVLKCTQMSRATSTIQNILGETKHKTVLDHCKTGCCTCCSITRERCKTDTDRIYEGHSNIRHPFSFTGNRKKHQSCSLGNTARAILNPALLGHLKMSLQKACKEGRGSAEADLICW